MCRDFTALRSVWRVPLPDRCTSEHLFLCQRPVFYISKSRPLSDSVARAIVFVIMESGLSGSFVVRRTAELVSVYLGWLSHMAIWRLPTRIIYTVHVLVLQFPTSTSRRPECRCSSRPRRCLSFFVYSLFRLPGLGSNKNSSLLGKR